MSFLSTEVSQAFSRQHHVVIVRRVIVHVQQALTSFAETDSVLSGASVERSSLLLLLVAICSFEAFNFGVISGATRAVLANGRMTFGTSC
jgi:hypothetical protein